MRILTAIVRPERAEKIVHALGQEGYIPVSTSAVQSNWLPARRIRVKGIESSDHSGIRMEFVVNDTQVDGVADLISRSSGQAPLRSEAVVWHTSSAMAVSTQAEAATELVSGTAF